MKILKSLTILLSVVAIQANAQGLVQESVLNSTDVACGSFEFMKDVEHKSPGYMDLSNIYMQNLQRVVQVSKSRSTDEVLRVPVVFHIVYNTNEENLPDSVLIDQIAVLNANFNRTIADTIDLRPEFSGLVKSANIEFYLATIDPDGNTSNGITRTNTTITNFGGILPYASNQTALIQQWVSDSLMYNLFRISQDSLGGKSAWNLDEYMNIWVGDLRILEPKVNNFEELVFFGLSTPPSNHASWPDSIVQGLPSYTDGTLMHFVNVGSNNPNQFTSPYNVYNGLTTTGKMLVHEAGHYLGLRHIWGDGDCSMDDYILDTPRAAAASQFNCSKTLNNCLDTINGVDLPNMVENYMDYSSAVCQNSFTIGQVDIMRAVLKDQRADLVINSVIDNLFADEFNVYPNPTKGLVSLALNSNYKLVEITVLNVQGAVVSQIIQANSGSVDVELHGAKGVYFIRVVSNQKVATFKVIKE